MLRTEIRELRPDGKLLFRGVFTMPEKEALHHFRRQHRRFDEDPWDYVRHTKREDTLRRSIRGVWHYRADDSVFLAVPLPPVPDVIGYLLHGETYCLVCGKTHAVMRDRNTVTILAPHGCQVIPPEICSHCHEVLRIRRRGAAC